jgi:hypothetical protein
MYFLPFGRDYVHLNVSRMRWNTVQIEKYCIIYRKPVLSTESRDVDSCLS